MKGKDLEGSDCGLIEVIFQNLPGGTEENHGKFSQDSRPIFEPSSPE
jgi:hypothetical protein